MDALQDHGNIYKPLQFTSCYRQIRLLRFLDFVPLFIWDNWDRVPYRIVDWNIVQQKFREDAEPLKFELAVYDVYTAPAYDAISYAWGKARPTRSIFVNNVELQVGENCHYSLRQARLQGSQYIWIDAICINQQDLDEKGEQVAMMYHTFATAARVLACIGPADDASDRILESLPDIRSRSPQNQGNLPAIDYLRSAGVMLWEKWGFINDEKIQPVWESWATSHQPCRCTDAPDHEEFRVQFCRDFNALLERPYFTRLWIAQELYAGDIECLFLVGESSFSVLDLRDIINAAFGAYKPDNPQYVKPVYRILELLEIQSREGWAKEGAMLHLELARHLLCHDPRDRVYGTLGVWMYDRDSSIVPDYNKSTFDLVLDLSQSDKFHLHGLQNSVKALEIGFHHSRLAPYLASHDAARPTSSTEARRWDMVFTVCRVIDNLEPLKLQDVLETQPCVGAVLLGGEHRPCGGADLNDRQRFALQCDQLLRERKVIKGIAWSSSAQDEWVLPATARIGDTILSTARRDAIGTEPDNKHRYGGEELALIVRIGPDAETITVLGLATCIPGLRSGTIGEATRRQWHEQLRWPDLVFCFEATVEEMMPLAIPLHGSILHARHAFEMPKCTSVHKGDGKRSRDDLPSHWEDEDGQGILRGEHYGPNGPTLLENVRYLAKFWGTIADF